MMVTIRASACAAAACLVLAGCCSNVTTDPRDGGLAGGVCGTATGSYDRRIAVLEGRASSLLAANAGLEARLSRSRREADGLGREIAQRRKKLQGMQDDLAELKRLSGEKTSLRAEISALMAEAAARERRIMAIEQGMRSAANERMRDDARRQAEGVPIDDLMQRIRDLRADAK